MNKSWWRITSDCFDLDQYVTDKEETITDVAYGTLTPREQEIMTLVAEGFTTNQISVRLFISPKTVENHRSSIMR